MSWFKDLFIAEAKAVLNRSGGSSIVDKAQITQAVNEYMKNNNVTVGSAVTIGTVSLPAANWVGDGNKYFQVVSIEGVTPFSQVDLTPSVEQLTTFHNKDLAFVTENENGVVTVYAIGDKPANDYDMQVTIKEILV